jgi:hypothetical protein
MIDFSIRTAPPCLQRAFSALLAAALCGSLHAPAQAKPPANPSPDVLILKNGDTLHGKFVNEIAGKVTFHTDGLGDVTLTWDKIKELHADARFAVLDKSVKLRGKKIAGQVPVGKFDVVGDAVAVHNEGEPVQPPIPTKDAQFIVDEPTMHKQMEHEPGFFSAWNGAATAGATLVTATQNQYTVSGGLSLVRVVPPVSWINPRNRTSADFLGSYGKITQPSYVDAGVYVPATVTKSTIYHLDGERDEYLSARFFGLVQTAFDHNFAQDLQLQQIYGGGIGWTALKTPKQEVDLKATIQYEKQAFISGSSLSDQNLIGSTISAAYMLHLKKLTYAQGVSFIPAFNTPHDYSANETDTLAFPAYKNLSFSVGTVDTYLNDSPATLPPTKRNSFQFTMGLTYAIKSKY